MACIEFDEAIAWSKQSTTHKSFGVTAFLTKHSGVVSNPSVPKFPGADGDICWYAVGGLHVNAAGRLFGDLPLSMNGGASNPGNAMQANSKSTVGVEIFPDGSVTYQQKLNGSPVGGMPPQKVMGACIGGALLSGVNQNDIIVVGVRRDPVQDIIT